MLKRILWDLKELTHRVGEGGGGGGGGGGEPERCSLETFCNKNALRCILVAKLHSKLNFLSTLSQKT